MNIQTLPWLKFGHDDYLASEFKAKANAFAKAAYLDLLCFAMKQRPALSIPNDDTVLAGWASVTLEFWQQIKDLVLSQFSLNQDDNRYYSPMLVELYSEIERPQQAEPSQPPKRAKTNAERQKEYKERKKGNVTGNTETNELVTPSNAESNEPVTPSNATGNEKVTASNADFVTFGGTKGGDLDLRLENENKEVVVVVRETVKQNPLPTTTTKFSMFFDFQLQPANVDLLMKKLKVAPAKNTADNLNNFIAHYLGSAFKNTQTDWELHYVKWLKREKDKPIVKPTTPTPSDERPQTAKEPAPPVRLADDRPAWMVYAERNAAKQAAQAARQSQVRH